MARRRAQFLMYGKQGQCADIIEFIEESGVILDIRDMEKLPLTVSELVKLIGYCDVYHFLNPLSESYSKLGLDKKDKSREEVLELMAADYSLIKQPIIRTTRLTTLGCNKKTVSDVLLLGSEGVRIPEEMDRMKIRSKNGRGGKSNKPSRAGRSSAVSRK